MFPRGFFASSKYLWCEIPVFRGEEICFYYFKVFASKLMALAGGEHVTLRGGLTNHSTIPKREQLIRIVGRRSSSCRLFGKRYRKQHTESKVK